MSEGVTDNKTTARIALEYIFGAMTAHMDRHGHRLSLLHSLLIPPNGGTPLMDLMSIAVLAADVTIQ
jgi:hypothetical protein